MPVSRPSPHAESRWSPARSSSRRCSRGPRARGVPMKQVIVVNEALGLPCGKLAAQVAHAAIGSFLATNGKDQIEWLSSGMAKVVLACESEAALQALHNSAQEAGLPVFLVADAGRTV